MTKHQTSRPSNDAKRRKRGKRGGRPRPPHVPRPKLPSIYIICDYCGDYVKVPAGYSGQPFCNYHKHKSNRPRIKTEVDVLKQMRSVGVRGERTASTTSRHKRRRDRFDPTENNYL